MSNFAAEVPELIKKLYAVVDDLADRYPPFRFTLDGRLVGDIGKALAGYWFGLEPLGIGNKVHDAKAPDGRLVQVKATQGKTLGLGVTRLDFEHLIAFKLDRDGNAEVIYNGAGHRVWTELGSIKSNSIGVSRLRRLNETVPQSERLARVGA